jgi:hypothetical protein
MAIPMSNRAAFRRIPVPQQAAQRLQTITLPAPTRGIIQSENESYMQPGGAIVQDNWVSTLRGVKLRGGCVRHCDLHALDAVVPPVPDASRQPVISAFEFTDGTNRKMFAAQATKLFEVTATAPVLIRSGQHSGNYATAQLANAQDRWLIACNDYGDFPLRYNGRTNTWVTLDATGGGTPVDGASYITGPVGTPIQYGAGLSYVWKYRNRLFFIQASSMDAWYLGINAVGGALSQIPLAGAATLGGKLIAGGSWSLDAGDGIDEKCWFLTNLGEVLIFTGTNPADPANWRQEGRYKLPAPMGINAHAQIGGDVLFATVDGIVPLSQAISKAPGELELATLTRTIKPLWRGYVATRSAWPWTFCKWDEYGALFVAVPGGAPGDKLCLVANNITGAWCRFKGYDVTCFIRMGADMYFGTQDGIVMQADRTGYDDGLPYVATLVGGWEMFGAPSAEIVWRQSRAAFHSEAGEPFQPQLAATTDYIVTIPTPPAVGPDPGISDVWDEGLWDHAKWDQPTPTLFPVRNTLWVSIGETGFAHAPIVQVTVGQAAKPNVELVSLSVVYEPAGVNV